MHIMFVCHGNICRSAMGERVARRMADERGLNLRISSTGTSAEELGNPMDYRARRVLAAHGYDGSGHVARQLDTSLAAEVDLFVAAERAHARRIVACGVEPDKVKLVSDFDPDMAAGEALPDPWYGTTQDFEETLGALERACSTMLDALACPKQA